MLWYINGLYQAFCDVRKLKLQTMRNIKIKCKIKLKPKYSINFQIMLIYQSFEIDASLYKIALL